MADLTQTQKNRVRGINPARPLDYTGRIHKQLADLNAGARTAEIRRVNAERAAAEEEERQLLAAAEHERAAEARWRRVGTVIQAHLAAVAHEPPGSEGEDVVIIGVQDLLATWIDANPGRIWSADQAIAAETVAS